jgi:hypothetical protein
MQRFATGPVIAALVVFTLWTAIGATRLVIIAERDNLALSWTGIAILYATAAIAAWFAFRLYRIRQAKRRPPLTKG